MNSGPRDLPNRSDDRVEALEATVERLTFRAAQAEDRAQQIRRRHEALLRRRSVRAALALAEVVAPLIKAQRRARALVKRLLTAPGRWLRNRLRTRRSRAGVVDAIRTTRPNDYSSAGPLVSIVIVTRDGEHHLRRLLPTLASTIYEDFEVVVVDNASSDGTVQLLDEAWPFPIHVIRNRANASFSFANNQGADAAQGEYLLFLNNDVEPITDHWLGAMVSALSFDPTPSAVGALLVYPERGDPATDLTVQHRGVSFGFRAGAPIARNMTDPDPAKASHAGVSVVPAVTAAALLTRAESFARVGGFSLGYIYGAEDVDLCLKLTTEGPIVMQGDAVLFHYESASQSGERSVIDRNRERNWAYFAEVWGPTLTRSIRIDRLLGTGRWTGEPERNVAITLTRDDPSGAQGDYFTAHELGEAFAALGWTVHYAEQYRDRWDSIPDDTSLVISLIDAFNVRRAPQTAFTIAWVRNWVDRWLSREWFDEYDLVVAGSGSATTAIAAKSRFDPPILPIATNPDRFSPGPGDPGLVADFVFTGNNWGEPREIIQSLDVAPGEKFRIFGKAWDRVAEVADHWEGLLPYEELPQVYRSSKIVLDDTAGPTIAHGFVNSRVFDALATGTLVITNNQVGSDELFQGQLPVYDDRQSLRDHLNHFLANDEERIALVDRLRAIVLEQHTYERRAEQFVELALAEIARPKVAIKISAPDEQRAPLWGDFHFAHALVRALHPYGVGASVDLLHEWHAPNRQDADVVIQLRGLSAYRPAPSAVSVMWLISHPDDVGHDELELFDVVCVASNSMAHSLAARLSTPVEFLPQATDGKRFGHARFDAEAATEVLFVGNTRNERRAGVEWAIEVGLPLTVIGDGWSGRIPAEYIRADFVPNRRVPNLYASAKVVLADHWPDMREKGFVSNRVFDVLAAGGFVVSDPVVGLDELFDGAVPTFSTREKLASVIEYYLEHPAERAALVERGRRIVLEGHTFAHRAERLVELFRPLLAGRPRDLDGSYF